MFLIDCASRSISQGPWVTGCTSIACLPVEIASITSFVYNVIRVITPIVLIIIGMFDMAKAITAGKEDDIKKAQQLLVKRAVAAAIIFLLFSIITWGLSILNSNGTDTANVITCLNDLFNQEMSGTDNKTINYDSECRKHGYAGAVKLLGIGNFDSHTIQNYGNLFGKNYYYVCYKNSNSKCTSSGMPDNGIQYTLSDGKSYCIVGGYTYDDTYIPSCTEESVNTIESCKTCCKYKGFNNSIFETKEGCTCVK